MQRKFILNLILIILVNLMIKPLYIFGIERNIQNLVGAADYGLFYSLFNLSFILSIILDPGITNYNNRHIAQNEHLLSSSFSNIISLKIFLTIIYIVFISIYALILNFNAQEWYLISLLVLGQILNSFTLYNRSNLAGMQLFKTDTFISILDKLLMIIICAPIIYFGFGITQFNIVTFITIQTFSFMGAAIISFFYVKKHTSFFKIHLNWEKSISIIKESYPFAILALLMLVYTKADTVLLKEIHKNGNEEVGVYAAAYRLIDALNMIAVLFSGLLYPIFARMIKEKHNIEGLVKTSFSLLVLPSAVFALFSFFYAENIMQMLYVTNVNSAAKIFQILIIGFVFICNGYIYGTLLTANGNIRLLNKIALFGVLVNIILNIIFIPLYGALGSAYVSVLTFFIVTSAQLYFCHHYFGIKVKLSYLIRALLSLIAILLICYLSIKLNFNWLGKYALGIFFSIIILIISRLLPIKQLTILVKQDKIV